MLRVGLTGGIGSGKSTVAEMLAARGASVIDADAISRSVTAVGGSAIAALRQEFGSEFITPQGALDRDRMRQASYADGMVRKRLEAIVHPLVGAESARQESTAHAHGAPCIVFDVPLLVESRRWRQKVDLVLVVDCAPEVQIARVMRRSALDAATIERIIATQATRAERLRAADIVVANSGDSRAQLVDDIAQVAERFGLSSSARK
jgi:dephospho-CoA kinase